MPRSADWQSAIRQTGGLRYVRALGRTASALFLSCLVLNGTRVAAVGPDVPSAVKLTGLASFSGKKWACLVVQRGDEKPRAEFLTLSEGERDGVVELVQVFEQKGKVKIRNDGVETVLSLVHDGVEPEIVADPPSPLAESFGDSGILPPPRSNSYWWRVKTGMENPTP